MPKGEWLEEQGELLFILFSSIRAALDLSILFKKPWANKRKSRILINEKLESLTGELNWSLDGN